MSVGYRLLCVLVVFVSLGMGVAQAHSFKPGDEVYAKRSRFGVRYHHSGVYVGNGQIVHVNAVIADQAKRLLKGNAPVKIIKTSLSAFARGHGMKLGPTRLGRYSRKTVVKRALRKVGTTFYYFLPTNNCQHFSSKVVSGNGRSPEVNKYLKVARRALANALKKAGQAITGKDNVSARIKNVSGKKVYACVYNGGDKVRKVAKRVVSISNRQTKTIRCSGNKKGRCYIKLSRSRRCKLFGKSFKLSKNTLRYAKKRKKKLVLSSRSR